MCDNIYMRESTFAKRLKELREENHIGQEELAREIGYSKGIISLWETENREPGAQALMQLKEYFGVTIDYLLGYDD